MSHHGYADWLGTSEAEDADQTVEWLRANPVDWVVVDHYALGVVWEELVRPWCKKILSVDDLANRPHDCDILLDQNLGRQGTDYEGMLPLRCERWIGPRYALLRPEFARLRPISLARRERTRGRCRNILITMGGIDKDNVTCKVLEGIELAGLSDEVLVTVILGSGSPWQIEVTQRARSMRQPTKVNINPASMADLMLNADLAIGASGSTSWERCCMGLPAIQVVVAENQASIAKALHDTGAALVAQGPNVSLAVHECLLEMLADPTNLFERSKRASQLVDGLGAARVAERLMNHQIA